MPKLKLTYFDGGYGEPRETVPVDRRDPVRGRSRAPSDWQRRKPDTPFGALPMLEVDRQALAQSNAEGFAALNLS